MVHTTWRMFRTGWPNHSVPVTCMVYETPATPCSICSPHTPRWMHQATISSTSLQSAVASCLKSLTRGIHSRRSPRSQLAAIPIGHIPLSHKLTIRSHLDARSKFQIQYSGCKPSGWPSSCYLVHNSLSFRERTNMIHDIYTYPKTHCNQLI